MNEPNLNAGFAVSRSAPRTATAGSRSTADRADAGDGSADPGQGAATAAGWQHALEYAQSRSADTLTSFIPAPVQNVATPRSMLGCGAAPDGTAGRRQDDRPAHCSKKARRFSSRRILHGGD